MENKKGEGMEKKKRGVAGMDAETAKRVQKAGGMAVSRNKEHMAEIGRKGGLSVSKDKEHMRRIAAIGGKTQRVTKGDQND